MHHERPAVSVVGAIAMACIDVKRYVMEVRTLVAIAAAS